MRRRGIKDKKYFCLVFLAILFSFLFLRESGNNVANENIPVEEKNVVERKIEPEKVLRPDNLLVKSNLKSEELRRGLSYELKEYAEHFVEAERKYGVNAVFLASVAAEESGWGRSYYAKELNNLYGWSSPEEFDSIEHNIDYVAAAIRENYLSENGCYFNGYTVDAVNVRYNGRSSWSNNVKMIMNEIASEIERG